MTAFRTKFDELCRAKGKALGRKLTFAEVLDLGEEAHLACSKERKRAGLSPDAEEIYALYPRKVGKEDALAAITLALKKHEKSYLLDKTNQFRQCVESWPMSYRYFPDGGDRCPNPSTWFRQGRYADDVATWRRHGAKSAGPQQVQTVAPEGWREWLGAKMPPDDHPAHGQLLSAYNCHNFAMLPDSWKAKCIAELMAAPLASLPKQIQSEQSLRLA